ncbi:MAG: hypothetical protein PHE21_02980, partial [Candidatus Dojkabacteria bacterium]|nr:hypothetical protein [Candidatus Dojkabacteria bacterium]
MKEKTESSFLDKDLGGAIFLILIGVLFLLITTGQLEWSIWLHIFKFWPLFVISWGISLILEGLHIRKLFVSIISLVILIVVGILGYRSYISEDTFSFRNMIFQNLDEVNEDITAGNIQESIAISGKDYSDIKEREIDINVAATEINILDFTEDTYIKVDSEYNSNVIKPSLESESLDGKLSILFRILNQKRFNVWSNYSSKFNIYVGKSDISTNLILRLGAGEGKINIEKLILESIDAKVGAGSLDIYLSKTSTPEKIILDIGAGEVRLAIPKEIGFDMEYTLGLGEIKEDG